jgi:hypothetical protein
MHHFFAMILLRIAAGGLAIAWSRVIFPLSHLSVPFSDSKTGAVGAFRDKGAVV